jgi:hypothetical protein
VSGPPVPDEAPDRVAELRAARAGLLAVSDPRDAEAHLKAMRSCAIVIADSASDATDVAWLFLDATPGLADEARSGLLTACRRLLTAVDQLLIGIAEARRLTAAQPAGWDAEAFTASRSAVRLLLADRASIDAAVDGLLQTAADCPLIWGTA